MLEIAYTMHIGWDSIVLVSNKTREFQSQFRFHVAKGLYSNSLIRRIKSNVNNDILESFHKDCPKNGYKKYRF